MCCDMRTLAKKIARLSELQGREMSVFRPLQSLPRHVDRVLCRESPKMVSDIYSHKSDLKYVLVIEVEV